MDQEALRGLHAIVDDRDHGAGGNGLTGLAAGQVHAPFVGHARDDFQVDARGPMHVLHERLAPSDAERERFARQDVAG